MKKLFAPIVLAVCAAFTASAATLNLANVTKNTTVADGTTLKGTLDGKNKISIAAGARVTLKGVTINTGGGAYPGLTCLGDATITLVGASSVKTYHDEYPGVYVPEGNTLTFNRPWMSFEQGRHLETDVIRYIEPFHICDDECTDNCPLAYEDKQLTWLPDPYYIVVRTAARRAEADPSVAERVQSLTDEGSKLLSAMRENDSAHTIPDTYDTVELGYVSVL